LNDDPTAVLAADPAAPDDPRATAPPTVTAPPMATGRLATDPRLGRGRLAIAASGGRRPDPADSCRGEL